MFCYDAVYANSKDLAMRTVSDKILKDRAKQIAINIKYDGYQKRLEVWCISFLKRKQDQELYRKLRQT